MKWVSHGLIWCARHGRLLLIAGLVAGVFLEPLALALKPFIAEMVAIMLFLAAFRIGPRAAIGAVRDLTFALSAVMIFQLAAPLFLVGVFSLIGWHGVLPAALVLMAAGSAISGAPNLAILSDGDPAPALRLLIVGTALLPATVIPVFWLMPELGEGPAVLLPALRLLAVIGLAALAAFFLRARFFPRPAASFIQAVDGASALFMMIIVIGLMAAVGPALWREPGALLINLAAAFAVNFGFQLVTYFAMQRAASADLRTPISIVAGNRNIALFLTALPASVTDPMLLFIGCYQIPMYLTPFLLGPLYRAGAVKT